MRDYVLNLILKDDAEQLDLARLERLAIEGLESGDAGTLTQEDWKEMRAKLEAHYSTRFARQSGKDHAVTTPEVQELSH